MQRAISLVEWRGKLRPRPRPVPPACPAAHSRLRLVQTASRADGRATGRTGGRTLFLNGRVGASVRMPVALPSAAEAEQTNHRNGAEEGGLEWNGLQCNAAPARPPAAQKI